MKNYKLLTPGPLTTTDTVKQEMIFDHCTWDDDYKKITQKIQSELLDLAHADKEKYACVLMQGSGTFGVESVLSSVIKDSDKLLIVANGSYGKRMADIAEHNKINHIHKRCQWNMCHFVQDQCYDVGSACRSTNSYNDTNSNSHKHSRINCGQQLIICQRCNSRYLLDN